MLRALVLLAAALPTVAAADVPTGFTLPQFQAATSPQQLKMILAAVPTDVGTMPAQDVARPPAIDIDADADGWFARIALSATPLKVSGLPLCERRVVTTQLRPIIDTYPTSRNAVMTDPLRVYRAGEHRGYWRLSGEGTLGNCPSDRSANYTVAQDASTAFRVLNALDDAIRALEKGDVQFALQCDLQDGTQPCTDGLARLRAVASHVTSIYTETTAPNRSREAIHRAAGEHWTASMRFEKDRLTTILIYLTPSPPVA